MAGDAKDWNQPAVFLSTPEVRPVGGAQRDPFGGNTANAWAALVLTAGRTVIQWTIRNTHATARMDVGLGADSVDMTLEPGESWSPAFNGELRIRTAGGAGTAASYQAVAIEV